MTGYNSGYFRWDCKAKGCYHEQLPNWDDIIQCFPRNIRPTDVDGMVEVSGHLLFIEQKGRGIPVSYGQGLAFRQLARLPDVTVLIIRPGEQSDIEALIYGQGEPTGFQPHDRQWLLDWLTNWAERADERPAGKAA